jgi:hypothetical protein
MSDARNIEAIATEFNGIAFRSRTEARWAVFFDAVGLSFEYEKKRFTLSNGASYLPDFWLPDLRCWFEVKAGNDAVVTQEAARARQLSADLPGQRVWLAVGAPSADVPNILLLDMWQASVPIEDILSTPENRYRFLEDRRDEAIFWLQADQISGVFLHSFMAGGPGTSTDHDRLPILSPLIRNAYDSAQNKKW